MTRTLTMLLAGLLLGACASKPPLEDNSDFAPIRPLEPAANALPTGSILGNSMHMSLFQGQRQWRENGYRVGCLFVSVCMYSVPFGGGRRGGGIGGDSELVLVLVAHTC